MGIICTGSKTTVTHAPVGGQTSRHLWALQQQDLAVDHTVTDHSPEDRGLRADRADTVGTRLHQRLLVDIMEVAERLIYLLPQLSGVTVKL